MCVCVCVYVHVCLCVGEEGEGERGRRRVRGEGERGVGIETETEKESSLISFCLTPCRQLAVIQVMVDSGAELNAPSCEIACLAAYESDNKDAVLAWHLAGRNSRRQSISGGGCPIKAVSEKTGVTYFQDIM